MTCPGCARENRAGARFCSGCGTSLELRCASCGAPASPDARFCDACGAALAGAPAEKAIARKVVTVVFADLSGSMALHERRDAESARLLTDRYHRAMTAAVEVHGGRVVQLLGDGVLAAFGIPRVAEDDAIRAVRAAVGMQRAFRELVREQGAAMEGIGLRVAVNTGEIVVSDDETAVIGDATNVAARLQHEAAEGEVIVGEATQRLVAERVTLAPLGSFSLRGREGAVSAYRVVSLEPPARAQALAFVGRDEELRRLLAVFDAACAAPGARLAVLLGSPGLGKSRLLAELARHAGDRASVLAARCDEAPGATFAPLAEALRAFLRIEEGAGRERLGAAIDALVPGSDAERARITEGITALLSGAPSPPEETFFVVRRFLAALAAVRPVVLAIDDLHWAEPLLLDLVEHLVQWSSGVPLLLVAAARPELREARSSLVTPGPLVADVVTLGGLEAGSATRLAANVLGASELPAALAGRVLATSEGNPLFVAELVRMLVQDGTLRREGERWVTTVELADLEMPPTIQVLLAARIERLRAEERAVLERAAVVGRHFSRAAVAHLLGRDAGALDARLEALRRSELIEPDSTWFLGEPGLRFHHVLIRDAAYRRVLRGTRAELHQRFADWVAARAGESVEHDETIGWHLEQAHENLRELGPLDARGRSLGERAARHLGAAGKRALARDDVSLAAGLLGRALACLEPEHTSRADLALDWCEALLSAGDVATAQRAVGELGRLAGESQRLRAWHTCFRGQLAVLTDPQALRATAGEVAIAAEALAALEDAAGEAKAHSVHASALERLGEIGACETALDRALAAARRARDRRRANAASAGGPQAALWGPTPVTRASGRCLDVVRVLRITERAPAVEAVALRCQALLEELRGRSDAARRMIASSRQLVEELGIAQQTLEADVFAGHIELLEGDAVAAERYLRGAYDGLRERGLGIDAARAGALLGRALLAQDRAAEAEALSHESEALAGDDLKAAMGWRGVRAEALARRGEHPAAIELARAAVEIAAKTDGLLDHADARTSLAVALRAAGLASESAAEERRALDLWEQKGATLLVERSRARASSTAAAESADDARRPVPRAARRRVRDNHATAHLRRLDAAIAARDFAALRALNRDDFEGVHRPSATVAGAELPFTLFHPLALQAEDLSVAHEPLATLGEEVALSRADWSATGVADGAFRVGAATNRWFVVIEAGPDERASRAEVFAEDRLDDAVACLYERYSEQLPDGPERACAAATARAVAAFTGPIDLERVAQNVASDIEFVDRRRSGFDSVRGSAAFLRLTESLVEAADSTNAIDEVLAARPDALLLHIRNSGVDRTTAGEFERSLLRLSIYGTDGRLHRMEQYDVDHAAEALARFEELAVEPHRESPCASRRRVRENHATAFATRFDAALNAGEVSSVSSDATDDLVVVHHPSGRMWRAQEEEANQALLLQSHGMAIGHEPLATLGEALALFRWGWSASASRIEPFATGPVEMAGFTVLEASSPERAARAELFAEDRLDYAIGRLYERYAELLPDGPERDRAAATALSVAARQLPLDDDSVASVLAPDVQFVDHRTLGLGLVAGVEGYLRQRRAWAEIATDFVIRDEDVLALRPDALLTHRVHTGTDRVGGGVYERHLLALWAFGSDGRITRWEFFDVDAEAEALDRFDELTAEPPAPALRRRVRENAMTRSAALFERAVAARDIDAIAELEERALEVIDHTAGVSYGRDGVLRSWRGLMRSEGGTCRYEPLATLGDSLALLRFRRSAREARWRPHGLESVEVGAFETDELQLFEGGASGRLRRSEIFPCSRLGDALVRLYARYAELLPEGSERERAAATARSVAGALGPYDLERYSSAQAPDAEFVDHHTTGIGRLKGKQAIRRWFQSLLDSADHIANRIEDVLVLRSDAILLRWTNRGTVRVGGGAYERHFLWLGVFGADGLLARIEQFDAGREAEALARFDELVAEPARSRFENAATHASDAFLRAVHARDWEGIVAIHSPIARLYDRRSIVGRDLAGDDFLSNLRFIFDLGVSRWQMDLLATRGDRLALFHVVVETEGAEVGPSLVEYLHLVEVDASGRMGAVVTFDPDGVDAAYEELDARYDAGEAAAFAAVREPLRRLRYAAKGRDWDAMASLLATNFVAEDHRRASVLTLDSAAAYVAAFRALVELAPDAVLRTHHVVALDGRGALYVGGWSGTRDGGAFEMMAASVFSVGDGRIRRVDFYGPDQLEAARSRFAALADETAPDALRIPPNAATRTLERLGACFAQGDWAALRALTSRDFVFDDRRRRALVSGDVELYVRNLEIVRAWPGRSTTQELLATAGETTALSRIRYAGDSAAAAFAGDFLRLTEIDADGRLRAVIHFEPDDRRAASREMFERWFHAEGSRHLPRAVLEAFLALNDHDFPRLRGALSADYVFEDHRRTGLGRLEGADAYLASLAAIFELSGDGMLEPLYQIALDAHGALAVARTSGTLPSGGEWESFFVQLARVEGDRLVASELFELEDLERAKARFEELRSARPTRGG